MSNDIKEFDKLYRQICNESGLWDLVKGRFNQVKSGTDLPWGPNGNTEPFLEMFRTFVGNVRALIKKYKQQTGRIVNVNPANVNSPALKVRQRIHKLDHFLNNLSSDPTGNKGRLICNSDDKSKRNTNKQEGTKKQESAVNSNSQIDKKYLTTSNDVE